MSLDDAVDPVNVSRLHWLSEQECGVECVIGKVCGGGGMGWLREIW